MLKVILGILVIVIVYIVGFVWTAHGFLKGILSL